MPAAPDDDEPLLDDELPLDELDEDDPAGHAGMPAVAGFVVATQPLEAVGQSHHAQLTFS